MDEPIGLSAGRQKALEHIEATDNLDPIDDPGTITAVTDAVNQIAVPDVRSPPRQTVQQIKSIYNNLPDEAQPYYLQDDLLIQRINTARRQFNDWMGKRQRTAEIPSPVESGRSNYPTRRAKKRSQLERTAHTELDEYIDKVASAAQGARQRALNAIGSSVAEQTENKHEQRRTTMREQLEPDSIVKFHNPQLQVGRVIRVNKKSVRVQYPNPHAGTTCPISGEEEPPNLEDRVQLDSEYLEHLDVDTIDEAKNLFDRFN